MTRVKLASVRTLPNAKPTKAMAVTPDDGTACTYFERGDRSEHIEEV